VTPVVIKKPCLVLVGPTAIGKTDLSLTLARRYDCEIISVDSMQIYRHMDIGTAKASISERSEIPHHLIDIVDPDENYDAVKFARDGLQAIQDIHSRGKIPLLTGGTGLYLRALLEGIFPGVPVNEEIRQTLKDRILTDGTSKLHEELSVCDSSSALKIHKNDTQRILRALEVFYVTGIPWSEHIAHHKKSLEGSLFTNTLQIGLTTDRQKLYQRINRRCDQMIESGLEEEVRKLLAMGYTRDLNALGSIGYRHILNFIDGYWTKEESVRLLTRDTRRYAKRQYTWFSKVSSLLWFDVEERQSILNTIEDWFEKITFNEK
jgi:tRNA dimethylallyltransferase